MNLNLFGAISNGISFGFKDKYSKKNTDFLWACTNYLP